MRIVDTVTGFVQEWREDRVREGNTPIYGLMAEFEDEASILHAAEQVRDAGYKKLDAYTPFPVHGLADVLGFHDALLPWLIFFGGVTGAVIGAGLQWYTNVYDYPWNVGGRPLLSWPQYIPITFEMTILLAAFGAVIGMLALNGLPRPHHPVFNAPRFELASQDRFFLCIEAIDRKFDPQTTRQFLEGLGAAAVTEVAR